MSHTFAPWHTVPFGMASLNFTSWNHVSGLLIRFERLRRFA
jgi:hypothetical protein